MTSSRSSTKDSSSEKKPAAKEPSNRQVQTAETELSRIVKQAMKQWDDQFPYPSYEVEREWEAANPSPRTQHGRLRSSVQKPLNEVAEKLMLRIRLGEVKADEVYGEIQQAIELINEKAGSIIGGSR